MSREHGHTEFDRDQMIEFGHDDLEIGAPGGP